MQPKLEWLPMPHGARGYRTRDGRYSVCSTGAEPNVRWEAWKMVPGGAWFAPLAGNLESEQFARRVAQLDADT